MVERPNEVLDILPYYRTGDKITVLIKRGYPRPLATIHTDSPVLDGKFYSGYIPEGIAVRKTDDLKAVLADRFTIRKEACKEMRPLLSYYTSPGGINEYVSSRVVELSANMLEGNIFKDSLSDFRESGIITGTDGAQLLTTAQTGALVEARLEMNLYNLFFQENIPYLNGWENLFLWHLLLFQNHQFWQNYLYRKNNSLRRVPGRLVS